MRPTDFILAKRNGEEHSKDAIEAFLSGYLAGEVPDYQVSAWLMAIFWRGMSATETANLTDVMATSGDVLDLSSLPHTVDKHSTGGVGDKTSLVLAPLLAACGATVAKMSGRGLGHTGGTIDKLESIPGFQATVDKDVFLRQAREIGVVISGQSKDLAPTDGLLYALRDATATVASLPLIASSIMSKKLAGGAKAMVLDVKVGSGAFMKTEAEARALAELMQAIGENEGHSVAAVLTDMSTPLGHAVGNALEVREAVATLRGEGPSDLTELCLTLAEQVLRASRLDQNRAAVEQALTSGSAYERFEAWIAAQGGDPASLDSLELAPEQEGVFAAEAGVLTGVGALAVGRAAGVLGGGRSQKGDRVDLGVGVVVHHKPGDQVAAGDRLATLYHRNGRGLDDARRLLEDAVTIGDQAQTAPLILSVLPPGS